MRAARVIAWLCLAAMSAVLIYGFSAGNFIQDGKELLANPWGIVSLVDLYAGFVLFSIWIVYREKSPWRSAIWVVFMMVLGFFTGALYSVIALETSHGDWQKFWLGHHATEQKKGSG